MSECVVIIPSCNMSEDFKKIIDELDGFINEEKIGELTCMFIAINDEESFKNICIKYDHIPIQNSLCIHTANKESFQMFLDHITQYIEKNSITNYYTMMPKLVYTENKFNRIN